MTAHASLAADEDLEFVVTKMRRCWPDVDIEVRADSGFGVLRCTKSANG
ncbi:MAG: hypothetical protein R3C01_00860 [Planctomycetaceae bacterium]